jgi:hemerythrin-like domain-containing protein
MKHPTIAPRPERSLRPSTPRLAEFESLDHAHRAALLMLQSFDMLLAHLQDKGLDDTSRALAKEVLAFFSGPGRHHHADEEKHVFPGLLAGSDVELVQHVRRLQQDHGWIEEDWRELHPQVEAIADHDHIALEESLVYPAAKRQREALLKGEAGRTTVM